MILGKIRRDKPDPLIGTLLGGCRIEERIGRGGMSTVYRARRDHSSTPVAIKVLHSFLAMEETVLTRFLREAKAASQINHPNVVRLRPAEQSGDLYYMIMEYVEGENLSELLEREGRLSLAHATHIAGEIAQGLAALHSAGIIHRDVKPANILISDDGVIKITDFGIARNVHDLQRLTAPGDLLGTVGFAAPEQLEGGPVGPGADLYSLGVTLQVLLTGIRPPSKGNPPQALGKGIPEPLLLLLQGLQSRDPGKRPGSASVVAAALAPYGSNYRNAASHSWKLRGLSTLCGICGWLLAFVAGAESTAGHGPTRMPDSWSLVLPAREAWMLCTGLFGAGLALSYVAVFLNAPRRKFEVRRFLSLALLACSLIIAYITGGASSSRSLYSAHQLILSWTPDVLLGCAIAMAAVGLHLGSRSRSRGLRGVAISLILLALGASSIASSGGSLSQAWSDLQTAMIQSGWAWLPFLLAAGGLILVIRHRGSVGFTLLAFVAIYASIGVMYSASLGAGSPPLWDAFSGAAGRLSLSILFGLGARTMIGLPHSSVEPATDDSTVTLPSC